MDKYSARIDELQKQLKAAYAERSKHMPLRNGDELMFTTEFREYLQSINESYAIEFYSEFGVVADDANLDHSAMAGITSKRSGLMMRIPYEMAYRMRVAFLERDTA